eukprot:8865544-Alexandrium_andersonii.AAC.1
MRQSHRCPSHPPRTCGLSGSGPPILEHVMPRLTWKRARSSGAASMQTVAAETLARRCTHARTVTFVWCVGCVGFLACVEIAIAGFVALGHWGARAWARENKNHLIAHPKHLLSGRQRAHIDSRCWQPCGKRGGWGCGLPSKGKERVGITDWVRVLAQATSGQGTQSTHYKIRFPHTCLTFAFPCKSHCASTAIALLARA